MSGQSWVIDPEPRWEIWKWPGDRSGVKGPEIRSADDSLQGMDWIKAATVEVMPVSEHEAARKLLAWAMEYIDEPDPTEEPGNHAKFHIALKLMEEKK